MNGKEKEVILFSLILKTLQEHEYMILKLRSSHLLNQLPKTTKITAKPWMQSMPWSKLNPELPLKTLFSRALWSHLPRQTRITQDQMREIETVYKLKLTKNWRKCEKNRAEKLMEIPQATKVDWKQLMIRLLELNPRTARLRANRTQPKILQTIRQWTNRSISMNKWKKRWWGRKRRGVKGAHSIRRRCRRQFQQRK